MLAWTPAGAVERPCTLQIRLQRSYPGRIRAGAPEPTRSMPTAEVLANVAWFTRPSPRSRPVDALVLSGAGTLARPDLGEVVAAARAAGVRRVTVHAGVDDGVPAGLPVDAVVLPVEAPGALPACRGPELLVNVVLRPEVVPRLAAIVDGRGPAPIAGVTFTYPFPVEPTVEAPPPTEAVAALTPVVEALDAQGVRVAVRGLPPCLLGALRRFGGRSGNRYYVDADHQLDRALLFFPDVVAFHKSDDCRFCAWDDRCDGFFPHWLRRPGYGRLVPID